METWYRASMAFAPSISPVKVTKVTPKTICYLDPLYGRVEQKVYRTNVAVSFFETWDEAHAWLLAQADDEVVSARNRLQRARDKYGNVKGMRKPADIGEQS